MANLQLLADEITNDPLTRGYSGMTDAQVAVSLNEVNRTVPLASLPASEVANAIDITEFDALSAADEAKIWNVLSLGQLNPFGIEATIFTNVFGGGSATITALAAARQQAASRGVEIGYGRVREGNVIEARAL